jgi:hypothetical protein
MLAVKKRSDKEEKRLAELHCELSDYRLSDPLKFDKKFQSKSSSQSSVKFLFTMLPCLLGY